MDQANGMAAIRRPERVNSHAAADACSAAHGSLAFVPSAGCNAGVKTMFGLVKTRPAVKKLGAYKSSTCCTTITRRRWKSTLKPMLWAPVGKLVADKFATSLPIARRYFLLQLRWHEIIEEDLVVAVLNTIQSVFLKFLWR